MCSLVLYQSMVFVYKVGTLEKVNGKTSNTIFLTSWHIQAGMSMIFIVYWQLRGHLVQLLDTINWPKPDEDPTIHRAIRLTLMIMITLIISLTIYLGIEVYFLSFNLPTYLITDMEFFETFGKEQNRYLSLFVSYFSTIISIIVLVFYVIVSIIVHGEFVDFNNEIQKIGEMGEDEEAIKDQLLEAHSAHINMAKMVQLIDNTFEVYTFVMIGLNIPTSIFGIISCFTASSTEQLLLILPAPLVSGLQLLGLTAIPARVHTAILEVRNILYTNTKIWKPYNEQVYQISNVFISNVERANLGFSLWGFAVITKPLILTTISITISYLTILIQLKENHELAMLHNHTMIVH